MKTLKQIANESLNTHELELAIENNEIFYSSVAIEHLIEQSTGQKMSINEVSIRDLLKKWGFDASDKIRAELKNKSKAWKIKLSDSELDELVDTGSKDGFKGGYRIKDNSTIVYVPWSELSKVTNGSNWGYGKWS